MDFHRTAACELSQDPGPKSKSLEGSQDRSGYQPLWGEVANHYGINAPHAQNT
jgi:hypothetical protein